ncbi:hypothetical protein BDV12DRAFT_161704 [Aspergillus spectabilis]
MSVSELRALLFFEDADTLAFIDPPSYKPTWSMQPSSAQSIGHRIHSHRLLETGSPVFQQLFEPKTQERNIRRRGGLPDGIKYIIDLTPPSTDDDAVLLLTELSCPLGIRTWADLEPRWSLPRNCVSGVDVPSTPGDSDHSGCLSEYSPSRHRAGIVQIIKVLHGSTPQLDTPCKLWTFFAVAKLYEITTMPEITQPITSWVYESNNARLIEVHPEITYRIAKGIQCYHLLRDSFSVLAGEEALLLLRSSGAPRPKNHQQVTVHGRTQEALLDDDDLQRVQYAGESLLARVIEGFVELAGTDMHWLEYSSTFRNVLHYQPKDQCEREIVNGLISVLKDFVRSCIFVALSQKCAPYLETSPKFEANGGYPTMDFLNVYSSMTLAERILTRTFWKQLMSKAVTKHDGQAELRWFWDSLASLGGYIGDFRDQRAANIRSVSAVELHKKADDFNILLDPLVYPPGISRPDYLPRAEDGTHVFGVKGYFSVSRFLEETSYYISVIARRMVQPSRDEMVYAITDSITSLTEKEFKYLPLWAGGCDDGTGGVYADQIPLAEMNGFSAPGPSIHTGSTMPSPTPSVFSFAESTVHGASHRATEGFASEVVSLKSDAMSEAGNASVADTSDYQRVDDELSFALDSSADGDDDNPFDSDSDSDDTVIIGHDDLSELEDVGVEDDKVRTLPMRQKYAKVIHAEDDGTVQTSFKGEERCQMSKSLT